MAAESEDISPDRWNYFSYYTEIEEHFRRTRGSGLFLLSPVDWALIEAWKAAGVPLEAVLRGIDTAFEKWRSAKRRFRQVNSLAYCAQAIHEEAQRMVTGASAPTQASAAAAPFDEQDVRTYLEVNAAKLRRDATFNEVAEALEKLAASPEAYSKDFEQLEQRLTVLEDKMAGLAKARTSAEELLSMRQELEASLRPYRGRMTADQLAMLERQFLEKRVLEKAGLPRLSLFYLQPH